MMVTARKRAAQASCRLSRGRLALGAAGEDARRTAAGTAALLAIVTITQTNCGAALELSSSPGCPMIQDTRVPIPVEKRGNPNGILHRQCSVFNWPKDERHALD